MNMSGSSDRGLVSRVEFFLGVLDWVNDRLGYSAPPLIDVDYLRSLPTGTLGHAWIQHLERNGLTPFQRGPRRQQLHDGVHVLTGYGTDPMGEAEVQAFLLGAKFRVVHLVLLKGILRQVNRQRRLGRMALSRDEVRSRLVAAFRRGRGSCFDPDIWRPEGAWGSPLREVQWGFNIGDEGVGGGAG